MSDARTMITEVAQGLFAELVDCDFKTGWSRIEELGFAGLLVSEAQGGLDGDWGDLYAIMKLAGANALALPLGETIIANWALARAGLQQPSGSLSIVADAQRAPWGRAVDGVVTVDDGALARFARHQYDVDAGSSPAGEPRDRIIFTQAACAHAQCDIDLNGLGAFLRVAQTAGALDAALVMSIDHANARVQFGKPLSKLQAVQQNLAILAAEAAAVNVAGQAAAAALDFGDASFEIAAAKIRANMAIGTGVAIAHQVHGAIGFTQEYGLQKLTRRMMGWRSEFGNDAYWSVKLGGAIAARGGTGLWETLTERSDRLSKR